MTKAMLMRELQIQLRAGALLDDALDFAIKVQRQWGAPHAVTAPNLEQGGRVSGPTAPQVRRISHA